MSSTNHIDPTQPPPLPARMAFARDVAVSSYDLVPKNLNALLSYTPTSALRVLRCEPTAYSQHTWLAEIYDTSDNSSIYKAYGLSPAYALDTLQLMTSRLLDPPAKYKP